MTGGWNTPGMRYAGLGLEFAASVAVLTLLGWWVDRHFGTHPWGVLTGALIGLVGGMYNMIREALGAVRSQERERRSETPAEHDDT